MSHYLNISRCRCEQSSFFHHGKVTVLTMAVCLTAYDPTFKKMSGPGPGMMRKPPAQFLNAWRAKLISARNVRFWRHRATSNFQGQGLTLKASSGNKQAPWGCFQDPAYKKKTGLRYNAAVPCLAEPITPDRGEGSTEDGKWDSDRIIPAINLLTTSSHEFPR
jgi:hypothetical protein